MIKLSFDEAIIEDFFEKSSVIRINITRIKILKMKIIFKFAIHAFSFICNSIEAEKINIQYNCY